MTTQTKAAASSAPTALGPDEKQYIVGCSEPGMSPSWMHINGSKWEWTYDRDRATWLSAGQAEQMRLLVHDAARKYVKIEAVEPMAPTKWVICRQTEGGQQFYSRWFDAWTESPWTNDAASATAFATDEEARVEARNARLVAWQLAPREPDQSAPPAPALGPNQGYVVRRGNEYLLPGAGSPTWGSLATARRMKVPEAEAARKDAHTFTDRENRQRTWNGQDDLPYPKLMTYAEARRLEAKAAKDEGAAAAPAAPEEKADWLVMMRLEPDTAWFKPSHGRLTLSVTEADRLTRANAEAVAALARQLGVDALAVRWTDTVTKAGQKVETVAWPFVTGGWAAKVPGDQATGYGDTEDEARANAVRWHELPAKEATASATAPKPAADLAPVCAEIKRRINAMTRGQALDELERRADQVRRGEVRGVPWDEVRAQIDAAKETTGARAPAEEVPVRATTLTTFVYPCDRAGKTLAELSNVSVETSPLRAEIAGEVARVGTFAAFCSDVVTRFTVLRFHGDVLHDAFRVDGEATWVPYADDAIHHMEAIVVRRPKYTPLSAARAWTFLQMVDARVGGPPCGLAGGRVEPGAQRDRAILAEDGTWLKQVGAKIEWTTKADEALRLWPRAASVASARLRGRDVRVVPYPEKA